MSTATELLVTVGERRPRSRRGIGARQSSVGYFYLLPAVALVVGVVHYGIAANVVYSTWDWNGISPTHKQVGLANYVQMLQDPVFWQALGNTLTFAVIVVFVQMFLRSEEHTYELQSLLRISYAVLC